MLERETLKLVIQHPHKVGGTARDVGPEDFTHGAYRAVWRCVIASGGPPAAETDWAVRLREATEDARVQGLVTALAVSVVLLAGSAGCVSRAAHGEDEASP